MKHSSFLQILTAAALAFALGACSPDTATPEPTPTPSPSPSPSPEPTPAPTAKPAPRPVSEAPRPVQPAVCADCGTVASITEVKQQGEGSGAGAVAGAVAGGVAGHQFGKGKGKDAATAAGAILGAIAGHQVEKQVRAVTTYDVGVTMEDGSFRTVNVAELGGLSVGARVRVEGNNLYLR